ARQYQLRGRDHPRHEPGRAEEDDADAGDAGGGEAVGVRRNSMPTFAYTIRDQTGALRKGSGEAETENVLARRLREQGFQVASIKPTKAAKTKKPGGGFGRVGLVDLSIFCRQFSTMIDAGVSLVRC